MLPAESSKMRLLNLVGTHDTSADYESETNNFNDDLDFRVSTKWIHDIIEKVQVKNVKDGHLNVFFDEEGEKNYIQILSTIPLWSNIMNESFQSTSEVATSGEHVADVESSFNSLKNGILAGNILQVHTFLQLHIDFVNAEIKLKAISMGPSMMPPQRRHSLESPPQKPQKRSISLDNLSPTCLDPNALDKLSDNNGKCVL